mgnify:CR=1 FL=1
MCGATSREAACNTQACDSDCEVSEWTQLAGCSATCGGGASIAMYLASSPIYLIDVRLVKAASVQRLSAEALTRVARAHTQVANRGGDGGRGGLGQLGAPGDKGFAYDLNGNSRCRGSGYGDDFLGQQEDAGHGGASGRYDALKERWTSWVVQ